MGQEIAKSIGPCVAGRPEDEDEVLAKQATVHLKKVQALLAKEEALRRECDFHYARADLDQHGHMRRAELRRLLWTFVQHLGCPDMSWEDIEAAAVAGTVSKLSTYVTQSEFRACVKKAMALVSMELQKRILVVEEQRMQEQMEIQEAQEEERAAARAAATAAAAAKAKAAAENAARRSQAAAEKAARRSQRLEEGGSRPKGSKEEKEKGMWDSVMGSFRRKEQSSSDEAGTDSGTYESESGSDVEVSKGDHMEESMAYPTNAGHSSTNGSSSSNNVTKPASNGYPIGGGAASSNSALPGTKHTPQQQHMPRQLNVSEPEPVHDVLPDFVPASGEHAVGPDPFEDRVEFMGLEADADDASAPENYPVKRLLVMALTAESAFEPQRVSIDGNTLIVEGQEEESEVQKFLANEKTIQFDLTMLRRIDTRQDVLRSPGAPLLPHYALRSESALARMLMMTFSEGEILCLWFASEDDRFRCHAAARCAAIEANRKANAPSVPWTKSLMNALGLRGDDEDEGDAEEDSKHYGAQR